MDKDTFVDECFADWDPAMKPSDGTITKAIRLAKTQVGVDLSAVVAGSDQQTLYENRVLYNVLRTLLVQSAQEYSSGAVGNRSDIFAHYRSLFELVQEEWESLKVLVDTQNSPEDIFRAIPPNHAWPGSGYDGLGRPI